MINDHETKTLMLSILKKLEDISTSMENLDSRLSNLENSGTVVEHPNEVEYSDDQEFSNAITNGNFSEKEEKKYLSIAYWYDIHKLSDFTLSFSIFGKKMSDDKKAKFKELSFMDRRKICWRHHSCTILICLFGPLGYAFKGLWRQSIFLYSIIILTITIFDKKVDAYLPVYQTVFNIITYVPYNYTYISNRVFDNKYAFIPKPLKNDLTIVLVFIASFVVSLVITNMV